MRKGILFRYAFENLFSSALDFGFRRKKESILKYIEGFKELAEGRCVHYERQLVLWC